VQVVENNLDAVDMCLLRGAEDQDVIQVYCRIAMKQVSQDSIYRVLEYGSSIAETEWHHRMLIAAPCRSC